MCGICGIFNYKTGKPVDQRLLKLMNNQLTRRGPDDEGYYFEGPFGMAVRRLSIIDLESGAQPIHDESNQIWTVYNGEIYNYRELRANLERKGHRFYTKSDTEVLVHLYEDNPDTFIKELNGMFGFALWDNRKKELVLARDRAGIKPLYIAETDDGITFASEIKALLVILPEVREDPTAINTYLSMGYVPSPLTGIKQIRKLEAGTLQTISHDGSRKTQKYIGYRDEVSFGQDKSEFLDRLSTVVKRQMISDVPIGLLLSGGIDSSLIAGVCAKRLGVQIETFTIKFENESYDESRVAARTANSLGLKHHQYTLTGNDVVKEIENIFDLMDEPLMDYSTLPTYFITRFAGSFVKVLLAGEGGDELFGGYPTYYLPALVRFYNVIPRPLRQVFQIAARHLPEPHSYMSTEYKLKRFVEKVGPDPLLNHLKWKEVFSAEDKSILMDHQEIDISFIQDYAREAEQSGASLAEQLMHVDYKTFLQDDCLQKSDRMSMANSIEVRVPFLDNEMIEFARSLPLKKKVRPFRTKPILREALHDLIPTGVALYRKHGFTPPLAYWLQKELRRFAHDSLQTNFEGESFPFVEKLYNDHQKGRAENSRKIWALIALGEWRRRVFHKTTRGEVPS